MKKTPGIVKTNFTSSIKEHTERGKKLCYGNVPVHTYPWFLILIYVVSALSNIMFLCAAVKPFLVCTLCSQSSKSHCVQASTCIRVWVVNASAVLNIIYLQLEICRTLIWILERISRQLSSRCTSGIQTIKKPVKNPTKSWGVISFALESSP